MHPTIYRYTSIRYIYSNDLCRWFNSTSLALSTVKLVDSLEIETSSRVNNIHHLEKTLHENIYLKKLDSTNAQHRTWARMEQKRKPYHTSSWVIWFVAKFQAVVKSGNPVHESSDPINHEESAKWLDPQNVKSTGMSDSNQPHWIRFEPKHSPKFKWIWSC